MSDHDDDDSSSSHSFGSIWNSLFCGFGSTSKAMTPAGRMMEFAKSADAAIKDESDITDDVTAALRRCQIRSMWPTWDHKAGQS
jgi:hypothetical protein